MNKKIELENFLFSLVKKFEKEDPDNLVNLTLSYNHHLMTGSTVEQLANFYGNRGYFQLMSKEEKEKCIKNNQLYTITVESKNNGNAIEKIELGGYSLNTLIPFLIDEDYDLELVNVFDKAIKEAVNSHKSATLYLKNYNSLNPPYENEDKWLLIIDCSQTNQLQDKSSHNLSVLIDSSFPLFDVYREKEVLEAKIQSEEQSSNQKKMKI
jgi:hypothetical protein